MYILSGKCDHPSQIRKDHDDMVDFMAELPLYIQSGALASFLVDYRKKLEDSSPSSIVERCMSMATKRERMWNWPRLGYVVGYVPHDSTQGATSIKDGIDEGGESKLLTSHTSFRE